MVFRIQAEVAVSLHRAVAFNYAVKHLQYRVPTCAGCVRLLSNTALPLGCLCNAQCKKCQILITLQTQASNSLYQGTDDNMGKFSKGPSKHCGVLSTDSMTRGAAPKKEGGVRRG